MFRLIVPLYAGMSILKAGIVFENVSPYPTRGIWICTIEESVEL
jgi:hypothetical protein